MSASYDVSRIFKLLGWDDCEACNHSIESSFERPFTQTSGKLRMRALPARILNHGESMINGSFPSDLLITHLKGVWWRRTIIDGLAISSETRKLRWNRDS